MSSLIDSADLTMRARIRDAAIDRFGRSGFDASVRAIAADAGVSAASVIKHYGSKEALRESCDQHVFAVIRASKTEAMQQSPGGMLAQLGHIAEYRPVVLYAFRAILAGGEASGTFLDHMIADAREYVAEAVERGVARPSRDEAARARFLVSMSLGAALLEFSRTREGEAETDAWWEQLMAKIALPALEIFTEGFFTDNTLLEAYLEYVSDPPGETPTPPHDTAAPS
ncbi:TetR family transcriptional regulator [Pseudoclavibacter endophyticus]|uniref:TetR/AcrR family transcriptional regulator n=1 Tax=Pseudoclavibacter endophyticus TaxID=1778590 RepID=A0A6H9WTP1_9MICO|nr:TetR family transcriptional regulator [Pseudoclavibacter endophyticus]KAB1649630.1 TetR/AcrR family transcriptional regulator [Pseudoclavibacter endophyticus]GGA61098.1 TetR family transcriptional regulator [Pseudoclavibacter endophyticus]